MVWNHGYAVSSRGIYVIIAKSDGALEARGRRAVATPMPFVPVGCIEQSPRYFAGAGVGGADLPASNSSLEIFRTSTFWTVTESPVWASFSEVDPPSCLSSVV
jgi:hypothetical protein